MAEYLKESPLSCNIAFDAVVMDAIVHSTVNVSLASGRVFNGNDEN